MNSLADKILARRQEAARQQATAKRVMTGDNVVPTELVESTTTSQATAHADRLHADQQDKDAVILFCSQIEVREQARKAFNNIPELAQSILKFKQRQPIVVQQIAPHRYLLKHGERRLRAVRMLDQETIRALIINDDEDAKFIRLVQLTENLQREEYEPLELAREFAAMKIDFGWVNREIAEHLHISESWVSKRLALLDAPQEIQDLIERGELSESEYHNNKSVVEAKVAALSAAPELAEQSKSTPATSIKSKLRGADVRTTMVSIPMDAALELAALLQALAVQKAANPIELSDEPTKKELVAILTSRASELRGLLAN